MPRKYASVDVLLGHLNREGFGQDFDKFLDLIVLFSHGTPVLGARFVVVQIFFVLDLQQLDRMCLALNIILQLLQLPVA